MDTPKLTNSMPDEWTPETWKLVVEILRKDFADYNLFKSDFYTELRRHRFKGNGSAVDIGCADGTFTKCWLELLKSGGFELPEKVYLVEPVGELLDEACALLQRSRMDGVTFIPIQEAFSAKNFVFDNERVSLVVASHVTYYFGDPSLKQFLSSFRDGAFRDGTLGWIVVRDRESGLYRKRFSLLKESDELDAEADQFSDHLLSIVHQSGLHWTTLNRRIKLDTGYLKSEDEKRVFYFLAHLKEKEKCSGNLIFSSDDWHFSETHVFVSSPEELARATFRDDDDHAVSLLAATNQIFAADHLIAIDLQLARIQPQKTTTFQTTKKEDNPYRPRQIGGRLNRWGWRWKGFDIPLLQYFKRHPSFLLFDSFFSSLRAPVLSEPLLFLSGRLSEIPQASAFSRLGQEDVSWDHEKWENSTFDVAWTEWCDIVRQGWREIFREGDYGLKETAKGRHDIELRCLAIPGGLAERKASIVRDAVVLDSSAALFSTVLITVSDASNSNRFSVESGSLPWTAERAYRKISSLLISYVGEVVANELFEAKQEVEQANVTLREVGEFAERLSRVLNDRAQPIAGRIMSLTGAENPLDSRSARRLFDDRQATLLFGSRNGALRVYAKHPMHYTADEEPSFRSWLGVAIHTLLHETISPDVNSTEVLFETALQRVKERSGTLHPCTHELFRLITDPSMVHLAGGDAELGANARGHKFLRMLILGPGREGREASMFSLAVRLLMQTSDPSLEICIKNSSDQTLITRLNFGLPETAKVYYEPKFPAITEIAHIKWFSPLVTLVSKVLGPKDKKVYVPRVNIHRVSDDCVVQCVLAERQTGDGSIADLQKSVEDVRKAYPDLEQDEWGDFRTTIADLVRLERQDDYRTKFELRTDENKLEIRMRKES